MNFFTFFISICKIKYPLRASNTCCQGLVECGLLILTDLFLDQALTQSGINLFEDQSPPPITLPALATVKSFLFFYP